MVERGHAICALFLRTTRAAARRKSEAHTVITGPRTAVAAMEVAAQWAYRPRRAGQDTRRPPYLKNAVSSYASAGPRVLNTPGPSPLVA